MGDEVKRGRGGRGTSKKNCRSRRRGGRAPPRYADRDVRDRRAPARPEAGDPPRLGGGRRAADRARPSLRMALCHGVRFAGHRRASGTSRTACPSRSSRRCCACSPKRPAAGGSGASSSCSTTPAGAARPGSPDGLRLVFQPAYTPEVQPAETLWTLVDEPIVNQHVPTLEALDQIISMRCAALATEREKIKSQAGFHWWPKIANPS